ncbi:MAG TPA: HYR domain-containing protein, partial [Planctomycetota bacterium]|nr:HYR domain-containing protein [Planctomycetota bacterium]
MRPCSQGQQRHALKLALLFCVFTSFSAAVAADILYVANVPLNAADTSIVDYVRAKGHYVQVVDDGAAQLSDTTDKELIMISETVDPAVLGGLYHDVPVRILVWDAAMQYLLGMTGPTEGTHFGYSNDDVRAHLVDHKHPLAGGLEGNDLVIFTGTAKPMGWGKPNKNADIIARQVLAGKYPLLYEYAPGAVMVDGTAAPSNRIFFFMADNGIPGMTDSGRAFLDAILAYSITGGDFTAPVIAPPADMLVEANSLNGAIVSYPPATVTDNRDPNPIVTYSIASGSLFPMGVTVVTIFAEDHVGNKSSASFTITVRDTTPPTIGGGNIVNGNITAEATSAAGAVVNFVGATDLVDPNPTITANPPSGSTFPLGVTTVQVTATDASNNTATGSFTVTVVDTTAPALIVPANMLVEANTTGGAIVNFAAT